MLLEPAAAERTDADRVRPAARTDALISVLEGQMEDLREQLRAERQGHAEARRLLAAALERIPPQLEAPSDERGSPEGEASPGPKPHRGEREPADGRTAPLVAQDLRWLTRLRRLGRGAAQGCTHRKEIEWHHRKSQSSAISTT